MTGILPFTKRLLTISIYINLEKFNPRWESRYFIYPGTVALPEVVIALIRADSGDRLLDYFKPGARAMGTIKNW